MPNTGQAAPAFTVETDTGERLALQDLQGKPVVLYFYPKDETPGCTTEACEPRDAFPRFKKSKAVILGVSPDSVKSQQKFKAKYDLPVTLLADPDHAVCEQYGVRKEKSMCGRKYMGVVGATRSARRYLVPPVACAFGAVSTGLMAGVASAGARARSPAEKMRVIGRAESVVGATESVVGRTESVVGRTESVVGRTESVVSRTESVVGRTESVVGRTESVVGRTEPVVGRTESVVGSAESVVGRTESVVGRTESVVGRTESVVSRTESVVSRTESVVSRTESVVGRGDSL